MKRISLLLAGILMMFTITACGNNNAASDQQSDTSADTATVTVTIDIDFPDDSNVADVDDATITVNDGSSVLAVLEAYADENSGEVLLDESSESPYVTSINGVAATDTAGWIYEVNDETIMESADKYIVKNGDDISWDFDSWSDDNDDDN